MLFFLLLVTARVVQVVQTPFFKTGCCARGASLPVGRAAYERYAAVRFPGLELFIDVPAQLRASGVSGLGRHDDVLQP